MRGRAAEGGTRDIGIVRTTRILDRDSRRERHPGECGLIPVGEDESFDIGDCRTGRTTCGKGAVELGFGVGEFDCSSAIEIGDWVTIGVNCFDFLGFTTKGLGGLGLGRTTGFLGSD